jgi:SAM-dependent methyltransferase
MGAMQMFTDHHYDLLLRFDRGLALRESVFAAVREGDLVIDAGCGTGILSLWAAQAGARRVVAVDSADVTLGEALAAENGFADRVEFVRADLRDLALPGGERCDVLLGMVYFNDPRRDAAQSLLTCDLRDRVLRPGGRQIPDRIVYTACPVEWRAQDIGARLAEVDAGTKVMEERYGLTFGALREAARRVPHRAWYPRRADTGLLDRAAARPLAGDAVFAEVDYGNGFAGYPGTWTCGITESGTCHAIVFKQAIMADGRLVFANESLSWVGNPGAVTAGDTVTFALDRAWSDTNICTMAR